MISNLMGGYDRAGLLSMLPGLPVPFAVMIAGYLVAMGVAALLRVKKERRGTFQSMFALSNTVFIAAGQPPPLWHASLPFALRYTSRPTLFGHSCVRNCSRRRVGTEAGNPRSLASGLRAILSPPLLGFLVA